MTMERVDQLRTLADQLHALRVERDRAKAAYDLASETHDIAERELFDAIDELPAAQREVLVATELEGRSFRELSKESIRLSQVLPAQTSTSR